MSNAQTTEASLSTLVDRLFAVTPAIRYVAVARDDTLSLHQKPGLADTSDQESDRYEELFVNPGILTLAHRRGELDCGGTAYVVIRYGNFFQMIRRIPGGHVSICFDRDSNPIEHAEAVRVALDA